MLPSGLHHDSDVYLIAEAQYEECKNHSLKTAAHERLLREICFDAVDAGLDRLATKRGGLTTQVAAKSLAQNELNILSADKPQHFLLDILSRFKNPLVIQLLVIMTISLIMSPSDIRTPFVLGGMILISVFLAYFQEKRSTKAADQLKKLV